jgi:sucrose synthase
MYELVQAVLNSSEKNDLRQLVGDLRIKEKKYFLRTEIIRAFEEYCHKSQKPVYFYHSSLLGQLIERTHEILLEGESIWFVIRPMVASQLIYRLEANFDSVELMSPQALLDLRDRLVNRYSPQMLEINFSPFTKGSPTIGDPQNIGQGLEFLNRYLCNELLAAPDYWLEALLNALQQHHYNGIRLLVNDRLQSGTQLSQQVKSAIELLGKHSPEEPYANFRFELQELGFEPGWGNTASRARETLELLDRLIDTAEPAILEAFVERVPRNFRIVLVSIHGWVGQEDVLGRSETAGQVVYVLDQARSLERQLREDIHLAGLDAIGIHPHIVILTRLIPNCEGTSCNNRLEKVYGTENTWLLRVPFAEFNPKVTQNWISKFEIWPYLENFALDAEREIVAHLQGKPNLIIGNYTDGNLVAYLLARRLQATHCNIAHSLEKSKYLFSDLYWQDLEDQYHFSVQFTADLIAMNGADFVVTSSYQEIVGTPDTVGQYESYKCFSMPQLYHIVDGIELFSPKFNVVTPGVNEHIFFPYSQKEERVQSDSERVANLLLSQENGQILGNLDDPNKRPIFALAPITSIKNLTGLVECFGQSKELQERCNLIFVTGKLHSADATNPEETREIESLHEIIDRYQLYGKFRWLGMRLTSRDLGEAYRVIADRQGIFVHFARFEAFGLTILEAMLSGLPAFATQFGGSLEIIQDGENGFQIDPTDLAGTAQKILSFLERCQTNPEYWQDISIRAIETVRDKYNWRKHAKKLLLLAKIYSFWNYVSSHNREALHGYLEALFHLIYKPRAAKILEAHFQR